MAKAGKVSAETGSLMPVLVMSILAFVIYFRIKR